MIKCITNIQRLLNVQNLITILNFNNQFLLHKKNAFTNYITRFVQLIRKATATFFTTFQVQYKIEYLIKLTRK